MCETWSAVGLSARKCWNALRCYWCEILIGWALKLAPDDYVPSCIEACVDAYERRGLFSPHNVHQEKP